MKSFISAFMYILKTKIDNALTQVGTYSTGLFFSKICNKKKLTFHYFEGVYPLNEM